MYLVVGYTRTIPENTGVTFEAGLYICPALCIILQQNEQQNDEGKGHGIYV